MKSCREAQGLQDGCWELQCRVGSVPLAQCRALSLLLLGPGTGGMQCSASVVQGSCIPAVLGGWCLCSAKLAAQGGQCRAVPAVAVHCIPAVLEGWNACSASSAPHPCIPVMPHVPAVLRGCIPTSHTGTLPVPLLPQPCGADRFPRVPAMHGRQCPHSAWCTMLLCLCGEKLFPSLAGSHRVAGSRLRAVCPVSMPGWL